MPKIVGTVADIGSRAVNTKFGLKNSYSITIDGERYAAGFRAPAVSVGDTVDLEYDGASRYKDIISVTKRPGAAPAATPAVKPSVATAGPYGAAKAFPVPALHPDRAIIRQNALAHASRCLATASWATDEEFADEEFADRVVAMARKFEAYSTGDLDMAAAERDIREALVKNAELPLD